MMFRSAVLGLLATTAVADGDAADPSGGWLSYAVFKAQPTQTSELHVTRARADSPASVHSTRLHAAETNIFRPPCAQSRA